MSDRQFLAIRTFERPRCLAKQLIVFGIGVVSFLQISTSLCKAASGQVVAWGDNSYGQTNVPPDLTNVVAIAGSGSQNLALKEDGTMIGWGYPASPALTNVMAIAGGASHALALQSNGMVTAWGTY